MDIDRIASLITEDPDVLNELVDIERYSRYDILDIARKFIFNQQPKAKDPAWLQTYKVMSKTLVKFIKSIAQDDNKINVVLRYLAGLPDDYMIRTMAQYNALKEQLRSVIK